MSAFDEIMKVLKEEKGNEVKVTVVRASDSKDDSNGKEEVKLSIKDSTRAAKIAKMKCMIFIYEQVKDLSGDDPEDVLGSVGHLAEVSRKPFVLGNDIGMLMLKKSEEATRQLLTELESDESKGD